MRRHLYFYTYLERPFELVAAAFGGDAAGWLPAPAERGDGGWVVRLDAGNVVPERFAHHSAVVTAGEPTSPAPGLLLRSVAWRSASHEDWFPILDGDLELAAMGDDACRLALTGSYRPPLSVVGSVADRVLGHHVAEAVVRAFVMRVEAHLSDVTAPSTTATGPA